MLLSEQVIDQCSLQYEAELDRCLELRRSSLSSFVLGARREIELLWEELMLSEDEKGDFGGFINGTFDTVRLARHLRRHGRPQMTTPRSCYKITRMKRRDCAQRLSQKLQCCPKYGNGTRSRRMRRSWRGRRTTLIGSPRVVARCSGRRSCASAWAYCCQG